jgi:hypothetical protein
VEQKTSIISIWHVINVVVFDAQENKMSNDDYDYDDNGCNNF